MVAIGTCSTFNQMLKYENVICFRVLESCKKLVLLDVGYCAQIDASHVTGWRRSYPNVSIKSIFTTDEEWSGNNVLYTIFPWLCQLVKLGLRELPAVCVHLCCCWLLLKFLSWSINIELKFLTNYTVWKQWKTEATRSKIIPHESNWNRSGNKASISYSLFRTVRVNFAILKTQWTPTKSPAGKKNNFNEFSG